MFVLWAVFRSISMIAGFYIHILKIVSLYQWFPNSGTLTFGDMPVIEKDLTEAAPDPALLEVLI